MTSLEVADSFVAAINSGDIDRLVGLMTPEHMFVDADGSEHVGLDGLRSGWREYFELVLDFRIEVFHRSAAWQVVIDTDLVAIWQLYANQHLMHEILERIRTA